jgi:hypothetical protein
MKQEMILFPLSEDWRLAVSPAGNALLSTQSRKWNGSTKVPAGRSRKCAI